LQTSLASSPICPLQRYTALGPLNQDLIVVLVACLNVFKTISEFKRRQSGFSVLQLQSLSFYCVIVARDSAAFGHVDNIIYQSRDDLCSRPARWYCHRGNAKPPGPIGGSGRPTLGVGRAFAMGVGRASMFAVIHALLQGPSSHVNGIPFTKAIPQSNPVGWKNVSAGSSTSNVA
jgi:hypothetical protein